MFDQILAPYYTGKSPKILIKLQSYIKTLDTQLVRYKTQFDQAPGAETKSVELLERIVASADINTLLSMPDMFYQYTNGIFPILEELTGMFDPLANTGQVVDFIATPRGRPREYILPVSSEAIFTDYPFDQDWSLWTNVRPLHILYMDSNELTFQAYDDKLHFLHEPPPLTLFSLDVSVMILMYLAYLKSKNITEFGDDEKLELPKWIHRHIIFPTLLEESVTWWTLSQYKKCILEASPVIGTFQDYAWVSATYGRIGSQYPQAINDIDTLITQSQHGTTSPSQALASLILPNNTTVVSRYHMLKQYCQISELTQYRWATYLRDKLFLDLTLAFALMFPDFPETSHLLNYVEREINLFKMSHPWNRIHDTVLDDTVTDSISYQEQLLTFLKAKMNK